jgi:hypothetical protein
VSAFSNGRIVKRWLVPNTISGSHSGHEKFYELGGRYILRTDSTMESDRGIQIGLGSVSTTELVEFFAIASRSCRGLEIVFGTNSHFLTRRSFDYLDHMRQTAPTPI